MDNLSAMKEFLRASEDFEYAYNDAKEFAREELNQFLVDSLELSPNTFPHYLFPINSNFTLGLDQNHFTIWIFCKSDDFNE